MRVYADAIGLRYAAAVAATAAACVMSMMYRLYTTLYVYNEMKSITVQV